VDNRKHSIQVEAFGGDSSRIILAGQSAGAQISLCMLVREYSKSKANANKDSKNMNILKHIFMYIGISGPYNLESLRNHLNRRGLPSSLLEGIFRSDLAMYSPTAMLTELVHGSWSYSDTPHSTPVRKPNALEKEPFERTWRESDSPMTPKATSTKNSVHSKKTRSWNHESSIDISKQTQRLDTS